jgi:DNA primase
LSGWNSHDFVEAVRDAGDIVRLISDYVALKPSGSRLKGLCPFHQEKTPSFSVDPNNQLFYCFGCQTGGDVFKFVMLYEKVDFREALEMLARRWGVPIPESRPRDDKIGRLIEMNRAAEAFFRGRMADANVGRRCRDYPEGRGIGDETIEKLGIGYAPDSWEALKTHLNSKRFKTEEMVTGGLVLERRDSSGHYDRFRGRVIFPIRDISGRTVAFGGRILGDGEPKYVNSPETPAYVKGNHLYGLNSARESIRKEGFAIVVEGYLDLAAVRQAGFENTVASLGTAITPAQVQLLVRHTDRVVVSYDGDAAGAQATRRSLDLLLSKGLEVRVVDLPEGMDPDDSIRNEGPEAYRSRVHAAPGYLEFLIDREARGRDLSRIEEQVAAVNAVLPHVAKLNNAIERSSWASRLADAMRIEDRLVLQELSAALRGQQPSVRQRARSTQPVTELEARLIWLTLTMPDARHRVGHDLEPGDLDGTRIGAIIETILKLDERGEVVDHPNTFAALTRDEDKDLLTRIAFREEPEGEIHEVEDCLRSLRRQRLIRERRELQRELQTTADPAAVNTLLDRTQKLARQIDALS